MILNIYFCPREKRRHDFIILNLLYRSIICLVMKILNAISRDFNTCFVIISYFFFAKFKKYPYPLNFQNFDAWYLKPSISHKNSEAPKSLFYFKVKSVTHCLLLSLKTQLRPWRTPFSPRSHYVLVLVRIHINTS